MSTAAEELEAKRNAAIAAEANTVDVERIYRVGLFPGDLEDIPARCYVVAPLKPVGASAGGIVYSHHLDDLPGTAAVCYEIVATSGEQNLERAVGDVVVLRNAMLEPLHPNMNLLLIAAQHVLAKVKKRL